MGDVTGQAWGPDGASDAYIRHLRASCRRADRLAQRIADGEIDAVLPRIRTAWIETELPSQCAAAWSVIWAAVRDSADRSRVMSGRERRRLAALPARLTAFRGSGAGGERGWSWTLDRAVAEDFAARYDEIGPGTESGRVCTAVVERSAVIACFLLGDEHELILDPRRLDWSGVVVEPAGGTQAGSVTGPDSR